MLLAPVGTGCVVYRAPVIPPIGSGFNQTTAPISTSFDAAGMERKKGKASSVAILFGLFSFGDASAAEAARNGNITTIAYADSKLLNVLCLFTQYTTIVYGY